MTAFGVLFALTLMLPVGVQDSSPSPSYDGPRLILMARLSDGIEAVTITEHPTNLLVSLSGPSSLLYFGNTPKALSPTDIQVWLLRTDGTSVPHIPGIVTGAGRSAGNRGNLSVGYKFDRVPAGELAAVVISYKDTLSVREIESH